MAGGRRYGDHPGAIRDLIDPAMMTGQTRDDRKVGGWMDRSGMVGNCASWKRAWMKKPVIGMERK
jgi:hypothetical protein